VGVTVSTELGWPAGLKEGDALRASLERAGLDFGRTFRNRRGRVSDTKLLEEAVCSQATLDEQAEYVTDWAREVLAKISSTNAAQ
jgi:hypothetical protein